MSALRAICLALIAATLPSCGGGGTTTPTPPSAAPPATPPSVSLVSFVTGLTQPVAFESLPDGRIFVLEQAGRIRVIQGGALLSVPFLDISSNVESGGEKGLLGLAFHPSFATNGRFFVNYTRRVSGQLQTVISEFFATSASTNLVNIATERVLLTVNQPFDNHNGGQLAFGPDGSLYIGLGDGGSAGDPQGNGQNLQTLLGKILRIDVNSVDPGRAYHIPGDNPFASGGGLPEIWAYGLRNPWRFSFDTASGRLFAGDVGQNAREEIDIVTRGANFGWNTMEGTLCFNPPSGCNQTGLTPPIHDYGRTDGGTVIAGFMYRGSGVSGLQGFYVFGDFISGRIWALREDASTWTRFELLSTGRSISSLGRDSAGELYVLDYGAGSVLRLVRN
jgi:glucose/arabinose dehydrogenase